MTEIRCAEEARTRGDWAGPPTGASKPEAEIALGCRTYVGRQGPHSVDAGGAVLYCAHDRN
jgi:hypothetical protein